MTDDGPDPGIDRGAVLVLIPGSSPGMTDDGKVNLSATWYYPP